MGDIVIGGTLHSAATGNIVARANEIFDSDKNKKQSVINHDVDESISNLDGRINTLESAIEEGGNIDERINQVKSELIDSADNDYNTLGKTEAKIKEESNNRQTSINSAKSEIISDASSDYNTLGKTELRIKEEKSRATDAENALNSSKANKATTLLGYGISDAYTKHEVDERVSTPHQNYVTVATKAELDAIVDPATDTIYRVSSYDFTANAGAGAVDVTKYSEYTYSGTAMIPLTVKSQINEIFDISEYHSGAIYADLTEALGVNGANVPAAVRKCGMSIKFVTQVRPASYTVVKTEGLDLQPTGTELANDPNVESGTYNASQLTAFSTLPTSIGAGNAITYWMEIVGDITTYTSWVLTMARISDNKYVRYNYLLEDATTNSKFTNVANWQGVTSEVKNGSKDLIESGGVSNAIKPLKQKTNNIKIVELPVDEEYVKITKNDGEEIVKIDLEGLFAKKIAANTLYVLDGNILKPVSFGTSVEQDAVDTLSFCDPQGNPIIKIVSDGNFSTLAFSSSKTRMSNYKGKTTLYVGDSISTENKYYWKGMLEDIYGVKHVRYSAAETTNVTPAVGGIKVRPHQDDPTRPMNQTGQGGKSIFWRCCNHHLDIYDFDTINLFGGTNDCSPTLNVGTVEDEPLLDTDIDDWSTFDFDSVSFASAYKGCIEMLQRDFPSAEIITNTLLSSNLANSEEVSKLIVSISNLYGLKCVPWRWSPINGNNLAVMTRDGVHPTLTGGRVMAGFYANIIGF